VTTGKSLYLHDVINPPDGCPRIRDQVIALGIKSFAAIPLKRHEQIVGVLFINSQKTLNFDDETKRILEMFAGHAGIAIEIAGFHAGSRPH
jgi:GAF domain-containing protein